MICKNIGLLSIFIDRSTVFKYLNISYNDANVLELDSKNLMLFFTSSIIFAKSIC